jgi:hypothetical protein
VSDRLAPLGRRARAHRVDEARGARDVAGPGSTALEGHGLPRAVVAQPVQGAGEVTIGVVLAAHAGPGRQGVDDLAALEGTADF